MDIQFKEASIPEGKKLGRKPLVNPFVELFPLDDKAVEFTIPAELDSLEVRRVVRQVRQAGKAVKRTGRVDIVPTDEGVTVTVWTVEPMDRGPKPKAKPKAAAAKKKK